MTERTPLQMLELIVYSTELNYEAALKAGQPHPMVMHPDSILIEEAKRVIKAAHSN